MGLIPDDTKLSNVELAANAHARRANDATTSSPHARSTVSALAAARPSRARRAARGALMATLVGTLGAGCLSRPVTHQEPTTKTNFTSVVRSAAIDKVDLLFMIDNSASMGDKQALLAAAVPDLIKRLFTPNCVDPKGNVVGVADSLGKCPAGSKVEFPPVHDMHVGIVSSSLGGRGSDACNPADTNAASPDPTHPLPSHNDDGAHLLNRAGDDEHPVGDAASPHNFLAWLPPVDANKNKPAPPVPAITDPAKLNQDFSDLVVGVHEHGCGYEAQLESIYRFLVQPDPYASLKKTGDVVTIDGVDADLLKQRADFLRPDSLVAIIAITDENDSTVDPEAFGGRAWFYEQDAHVYPGTGKCATAPNDPGCLSCYLAPAKGDPNCAAALTDTTDQVNVRFFHMKQRFGIDPQFPVSRYVSGFSSQKVPDRNGEHPKDANGSPSFGYVGNAKCTNPLFAATLPTDPTKDLCNLPVGPRDPSLVFFALIGGVPWQLLADANGAFKPSLKDDDWNKILGKDPLNYDFTGADPHMLESITARPGVGADDIHTREWNTLNKDLQYACTFDFVTPKDCNDPKYKQACDCSDATDSPLCDATTPTTQDKGKAYPTIRELAVARSLGDQAIVASICPKDPKNPNGPDGQPNPDYGYRPAVRSIVDRLKNALANQCLPQKLVADQTGNVPCLILETLNQPGAKCDPAKGLSDPDPAIVAKFKEQQAATQGDAGTDIHTLTVCQVKQLAGAQLQNGTCDYDGAPAGWCYVQGAAAGTCPQAIKFSSAGNPVGATISLQCIESNASASSGGDGG